MGEGEGRGPVRYFSTGGLNFGAMGNWMGNLRGDDGLPAR